MTFMVFCLAATAHGQEATTSTELDQRVKRLESREKQDRKNISRHGQELKAQEKKSKALETAQKDLKANTESELGRQSSELQVQRNLFQQAAVLGRENHFAIMVLTSGLLFLTIFVWIISRRQPRLETVTVQVPVLAPVDEKPEPRILTDPTQDEVRVFAEKHNLDRVPVVLTLKKEGGTMVPCEAIPRNGGPVLVEFVGRLPVTWEKRYPTAVLVGKRASA